MMRGVEGEAAGDRIVRGLAAFAQWVELFKLGAWFVFLVLGPPIFFWRGMVFAAGLLSGLGVLLDLVLFVRPSPWVPERWRWKALAGLLAMHLGLLGSAGYLLTRPPSGGWARIAGTERWSSVVAVASTDEGLFVMSGGGDSSPTRVLVSVDGERFDDLDYPGGFGWELVHDGAGRRLIALPRYGNVLYAYALDEGGWTRHARPEGHADSIAARAGQVHVVVKRRLYAMDPDLGGYREVPEAGHCRNVAASPDPAHALVLAVGHAVMQSDDGGASFRDVSPAVNPMTGANATVGGGGYRYVYDGGVFASHFYAGEPGRELERRSLPDADTRVMVANPADGREVWAGTWGRGVFRSRDAGRTWEAMGLERAEVRALGVAFRDGKVWAPTGGMVIESGLFVRGF